jgi:hypothetical protein
VGKIGHFQEGNQEAAWSELWSAMESGKEVYGSYGTGTRNYRLAFVESILRFKRRLLGGQLFCGNDYPGHVIFGSCNRLKTSSDWHCAIDANLLFQLHGQKEWFTLEHLPASFSPKSATWHAHSVDRQLFYSDPRFDPTEPIEVPSDVSEKLFREASHITLTPGDLLINPPFSWHAIKIDQFSISLSLRGDREDVCAWVGHRYFEGRMDDPMFLCFAYLFMRYGYMDWANAVRMGMLKRIFMSFLTRLFPNLIKVAYIRASRRVLSERKRLDACFSKYSGRWTRKGHVPTPDREDGSDSPGFRISGGPEPARKAPHSRRT